MTEQLSNWRLIRVDSTRLSDRTYSLVLMFDGASHPSNYPPGDIQVEIDPGPQHWALRCNRCRDSHQLPEAVDVNIVHGIAAAHTLSHLSEAWPVL